MKLALLFTLLFSAQSFANSKLCALLSKEVSNTGELTQSPDQIIVGKSQRKMILLRKEKILKQYHVSLGTVPVGKKEKSGDGKTPEGSYFVESKNANSKFHLALQVSYPNAQDLANAQKLGVDPGGDIMIHGFPKDEAYNLLATGLHNTMANWTQGCVAVTNTEIEEIYPLVEEETPIQICP